MSESGLRKMSNLPVSSKSSEVHLLWNIHEVVSKIEQKLRDGQKFHKPAKWKLLLKGL